MVINGFSLLSPGLSCIFEVTNEFFFLGIDTNNRMPRLDKPLLDSANVAELLVSLRVLSRRNRLAVGLERIVLLLEQPSNAGMTQQHPDADQIGFDATQTLTNPFARSAWVSCYICFHNRLQRLLDPC